MTFSIIVTCIVFVCISLLWVLALGDAILNKKENDKIKKLLIARGMKPNIISPQKVLIVFVLWFMSGYYLFG